MSIGRILTGVGVGVIIGLLIAPEKGSETRKKLSKAYNGVADSVQDIVDGAKDVIDRFRSAETEDVEERSPGLAVASGSESWQPKDL